MVLPVSWSDPTHLSSVNSCTLPSRMPVTCRFLKHALPFSSSTSWMFFLSSRWLSFTHTSRIFIIQTLVDHSFLTNIILSQAKLDSPYLCPQVILYIPLHVLLLSVYISESSLREESFADPELIRVHVIFFFFFTNFKSFGKIHIKFTILYCCATITTIHL